MTSAPTNALNIVGLFALLLVLGSLALAIILFSRRNFRFSLGGLVLFVIAAAIMFGAVAYHLRTVRILQDHLAMEREKALVAMELAERQRATALKQQQTSAALSAVQDQARAEAPQAVEEVK
jgi:hypothetical protein